MNPINFDPDTHTGPIPSPCNGVCRISSLDDLCDGCLRSIDEIAAWSSASDTAKRHIWRLILQRRTPRAAS